MLELYIARHGQTEWNVAGRMQGWLNSPLTEKGIASADQLRQELQSISFDAYYSSPSERAYKTLEIAIGDSTKIVCDERLKEIGLGAWQGMLVKDIEANDPERFRQYFYEPENFSIEEGENYFTLYDRVHAFTEDIKRRHFKKGVKQRVIIITHGITLMMLRLIFHNGTIENIRDYHVAGNAKLHVYQFDGNAFKCIKEPKVEF